MKNSDILIRDPFVLPWEGNYYLYGTRSFTCWGDRSYGFDVFAGTDLENWSEPYEVFHGPENFWADRNFWAAEVYHYKGAFYMFASFCDLQGRRGTQILKADNPLGPFHVHSPEPATPKGWVCLDGTLFIDKDEKPYMVFCHEWAQIKDGSYDYIPLKEDLSGAAGNAVTIFRSSEGPWVVALPGHPECYVSDGPFLYRCGDGTLLLLWSSFSSDGYSVGISVSKSGSLKGPWRHIEKPLFARDGGHCMVFRDFTDTLRLALHQPNTAYHEHPLFIKLYEKDGMLYRE